MRGSYAKYMAYKSFRDCGCKTCMADHLKFFKCTQTENNHFFFGHVRHIILHVTTNLSQATHKMVHDIMKTFKERDVDSRREHKKYMRNCAKDPLNTRKGHAQRTIARTADAARHKAAWDEMATPTAVQTRVASYIKSCLGDMWGGGGAEVLTLPTAAPHARELQYVYSSFGGPMHSSTLYFTDGFNLYSYRCACRCCSRNGHGGRRCITLNLPSNSTNAPVVMKTNPYFVLEGAHPSSITKHQGSDRLKFAYWLSRNVYFD
jgi:hypothetical protein